MSTPGSEPPATRALLPSAVTAAGAAVVVNTVVRLLARTLLDVHPGFEPLTTAGPVIAFTTAGVTAGALLRRLLPVRWFVVTALVLTALSLLPDVGLALDRDAAPMPGAGPVPMAVLGLMHLLTAAIAIPLLALTPIGRRP
jgi:hypothetical protein